MGNVKFHILPVVVGTAVHTANSGAGHQPTDNLTAQMRNLFKERCLQGERGPACQTELAAMLCVPQGCDTVQAFTE